ncbi:MAG: 3-hydroxyacyl-CoA dehydrogenase family protein [Bacteroidota bacterium]
MSRGKNKAAEKAKQKASVYVVGEVPMVDEYADLCREKGYEVFTHRISDQGASSAKSLKKSATVPRGIHLALELTNTDIESKRNNIRKLDEGLPPTCAILSSSVTVSASEQATWIKGKHRLVGFAALPSFSRQPLAEVAPTVHSPAETLEVVRRFFGSLGKECEYVQDRVGMVLPRILCQIMNEACFVLQDEVANPQDIDTAMKLGVHYPHGPVEWADRIGFQQVFAVLAALQNDLQEDRYRIAPLLKQMAQTGEWWKRLNPQNQGKQ